MTDAAVLEDFGQMIAPTTLQMRRLLPGRIDRVWAYLVEEDLRRTWLAAGVMPAEVGAAFELVWRNDELTVPPGVRPDGFGAEHRMQSRITAFDPPHRLGYAWGQGEVVIDLVERADGVLLTLTHTAIEARSAQLGISAGWHAHIDILGARMAQRPPLPHWDNWTRLRAVYDARLPA